MIHNYKIVQNADDDDVGLMSSGVGLTCQGLCMGDDDGVGLMSSDVGLTYQGLCMGDDDGVGLMSSDVGLTYQGQTFCSSPPCHLLMAVTFRSLFALGCELLHLGIDCLYRERIRQQEKLKKLKMSQTPKQWDCCLYEQLGPRKIIGFSRNVIMQSTTRAHKHAISTGNRNKVISLVKVQPLE